MTLPGINPARFTERHYEILRFGINGIVATLVHYAVFYSLYIGIALPSAGLSNSIAALVGISCSYVGSRYFVFPSRRGPIKQELTKFVLLYASLALANGAIVWIWTDLSGLNHNIGFLIAIIVQTVLSFLGNRFFVFSNRE